MCEAAPIVADRLGISPEGARRALDKLTQIVIVERHSDTWPHTFVHTNLLNVLDEKAV